MEMIATERQNETPEYTDINDNMKSQPPAIYTTLENRSKKNHLIILVLIINTFIAIAAMGCAIYLLVNKEDMETTIKMLETKEKTQEAKNEMLKIRQEILETQLNDFQSEFRALSQNGKILVDLLLIY